LIADWIADFGLIRPSICNLQSISNLQMKQSAISLQSAIQSAINLKSAI